MSGRQFSEQLRELTIGALQGGGMNASEVIGGLEIAKLNVDRLLVQQAQMHAAKEAAKSIIPAIHPLPNHRPD